MTKPNIPAKIHKNMTQHDKLYGTTTMGARGQVVIPAEARKDLGLKPGDQLVVMGKFNKALGLIKAAEMESLVNIIMKNFAGSGTEKRIRSHALKTFGRFIHTSHKS